jgi:hypothetical protein
LFGNRWPLATFDALMLPVPDRRRPSPDRDWEPCRANRLVEDRTDAAEASPPRAIGSTFTGDLGHVADVDRGELVLVYITAIHKIVKRLGESSNDATLATFREVLLRSHG